MATRVRFPPNGVSSSGAPAFSSHWDNTASAVRRMLDTTGAEFGSQYGLAVAEISTSRQSLLVAQFQSKPLLAQTISGTLKGQLQCMESDAAADMALQVHVRVYNPTSGTDRGVLWAPDKTYTAVSATPGNAAYEFATSKTNRKAPSGWSGSGVSLSSVAASNGDILLIEVGYRHCNTVSTSYTGTIYFGGYVSGGDLAEDETSTSTATAWMEFSQDITFQGTTLIEQSEKQIARNIKLYTPPPQGVGQVWPRGAGRQ